MYDIININYLCDVLQVSSLTPFLFNKRLQYTLQFSEEQGYTYS